MLQQWMITVGIFVAYAVAVIVLRADPVVDVSRFFVFQQITGINVPLYYGPKLLGPIFEGSNNSLVWTTIAGSKSPG